MLPSRKPSGENSNPEGSTLYPVRQNGVAGEGKPKTQPVGKRSELEDILDATPKTDFFLRQTGNEVHRGKGGVLEDSNYRSGLQRAFEEGQGVEIRPYNPSNWFEPKGVFRKRGEIEKKGLPVFQRCKFVTLTIDPRHGGHVDTYEIGKARIRRFLDKFRKAFECKMPWAWKLEFQENGYAHWHLIIDYKEWISPEYFEVFNRWWGLGRVNVKGITRRDFEYLFKYVSKGAFSDTNDSGINLPDWVLDYRKLRKDGRPTSGIRFWQTGGGFYEAVIEAAEKEESEQKYSRVSYTIREQVAIWNRKATAVVVGRWGTIIASKQIFLRQPWSEFFQTMVWKLIDGTAAYVGDSWRCRVKLIQKEIQLWQMKHLERMEFIALRQTTGSS